MQITYLFPLAALAAIIVAGLFQAPDLDISIIQRIMAELPMTALVVWLIFKLNAQKKETVENVVSSFLELYREERKNNRQQIEQLLSLLQKTR